MYLPVLTACLAYRSARRLSRSALCTMTEPRNKQVTLCDRTVGILLWPDLTAACAPTTKSPCSSEVSLHQAAFCPLCARRRMTSKYAERVLYLLVQLSILSLSIGLEIKDRSAALCTFLARKLELRSSPAPGQIGENPRCSLRSWRPVCTAATHTTANTHVTPASCAQTAPITRLSEPGHSGGLSHSGRLARRRESSAGQLVDLG